MRFQVTSSYIKRQNRRSVYIAIILTTLSAGCLAALVNATSLSEMVFPSVGLILFLPPIFRTYKHIQEGADLYAVIDLDVAEKKLAVHHKEIVVTVDITQINRLRLQYTSGQLASVLLKTRSGEIMRFEGYEKLEVLASILKRLTPADKVSNATFYHR